MEYQILDSDGPAILTPKLLGDERGYFMETFRQNDFERHCGSWSFVQDNQSKSKGCVLRGLHYQLNHPQGKLARVIHGRVFDVAIDLRQSSKNFGKAYGVELDNITHQIFWIPPGFAHGFLVLSKEAEFIYKCTDYYDPEDERCIIWNDPAISIPWPLNGQEPILSQKDLKGVNLKDAPCFA